MRFSSMIRPVLCVGAAILLTLPAAAADAVAAPVPPGPSSAVEAKKDYVRYIGDNLRGKLETVVVTMKNPAGVTIELIGAVHIADGSYYKALMELFTKYDALLFELVDGQKLKESMEIPSKPKQGKKAAAAATNPSKDAKGSAAEEPKIKPPKPVESGPKEEEDVSAKDDVSFSILRGMMTGLGSYLRLEYQTDGIDYHTKNFVHADVSLAEFQRLQDEKGESFGTMFQKAFQASLTRGPQKDEEPTGGQLLLALLGDSSGIKIAMARMLAKAEDLSEDLGFGSDSVIVGERNRVALEVFDREVKAGRKNMGLFYGAAHLADLEKRLEQRGYQRTGERWLTAWDIKPRSDEKKK